MRPGAGQNMDDIFDTCYYPRCIAVRWHSSSQFSTFSRYKMRVAGLLPGTARWNRAWCG